MVDRNIIAIIPARGGSKSIHKKNIIYFCDKPLIAWSIEHARNSKYVKDVFVTTDDKEIAEISKKYGAKIVGRPSELSGDTSSSEEALLHAIYEIEKSNKIDAVVFIQATSPVRDKDDITKALEMFFSENADSLFSAAILEDFCVWEIGKDSMKSITFDYKSRSRRQDRKPYYLENGSIYIFKPDVIRQYNNRLGGKIIFYPMPVWKSYEIDNIEDLEICEYFMKKKILNKDEYKYILRNIQLIVYDFDGIMTDNKVMLREDGLESVMVNRSDGLAIEIIKDMGIEQIILSKEKNRVVETRANKLGIPVIKGVDSKKEILVSYCNGNNIQLENVVYVGNDVNDVEAMKIVGYPMCPLDAYEDIKSVAKFILNAGGGDGVIRELIKYIQKKGQ